MMLFLYTYYVHIYFLNMRWKSLSETFLGCQLRVPCFKNLIYVMYIHSQKSANFSKQTSHDLFIYHKYSHKNRDQTSYKNIFDYSNVCYV